MPQESTSEMQAPNAKKRHAFRSLSFKLANEMHAASLPHVSERNACLQTRKAACISRVKFEDTSEMHAALSIILASEMHAS